LTGKVYEQRLIEAYISENGAEPGTDEPLTVEDLVVVNSEPTVRPRPPQLTSIPAMLSSFQAEWDALALQTYKLQQDLKKTQQELSTALYEKDAAIRVIVQVTQQRDEAREALAKVSVGRGRAADSNGDAMQVDSAPLPEPILQKIDSVQQRYDIRDERLSMRLFGIAVCPKPDESALSQKTGQLPSRYRTIPLRLPQSRYFQADRFLLYTSLAIWRLWLVVPAMQAWFLCRRTNYCKL
jgi:hypothetical protein